MLVAEIGVRTVPLPRLGRFFGAPLSTSQHEPLSTLRGDRISSPTGALEGVEARGEPDGERFVGSSAPMDAGALRRLKVLGVIAPRWPFCKGPCLRQALVAGRILRGRQPRLRIGVAVEGSDVMAHAWLEVDGFCIGHDGRFDLLTAPPLTPDAVRAPDVFEAAR